MREPNRIRPVTVALVCVLALSACNTGDKGEVTQPAPSVSGSTEDEKPRPSPDTATDEFEESAPTTQSETASPTRPVSVLGLADQRHRGDRLRLGAVREQTDSYTSYDVTYRSRSTTQRDVETYTISGVLNVPRGPGRFPAVVLAHGYIDPELYVSGQGMTRERGYLAERGYVALHVDYRNHAESDDDPRHRTRMRLGYSADVINAVKALRNYSDRSAELAVDSDRIALFGRSMGGGVTLKALEAEAGLVRAAAAWASVSSLEADNYRRFMQDPEDAGVREALTSRYGGPATSPRFWWENSSRPYLDRITEPVLMVHGRLDETCPPRWAAATQAAMTKAGVDSRLGWYDDGHAFGPSFNKAMARTVRFFDNRLT